MTNRRGSDWQPGATFDRDLADELEQPPVIIVRPECHTDGSVCGCAGECDHSCKRQPKKTLKEICDEIFERWDREEAEGYVPKPPIEPENLKTGYLIFAGERDDVREIVSRVSSYLATGWNVQVIDGSEL